MKESRNRLISIALALSLPYFDRHLAEKQIHCLKPLNLPLRMRKRKVVPAQHRGQQDSLLEIGNIATDAATSASREGEEVRLEVLSFFTEPSLGYEFLGLRELSLASMRDQRRHTDGDTAGDEVVHDV